MTYRLKFLPKALKEWKKLSPPIREQFTKKLKERLLNPRVASDKLSGFESVYKIKLRTVGYRLAYEVVDSEVVVYVLALGKREKNEIYQKLKNRNRDES
jgi:mRNA interferase RelE/StbE